MTILDDNYITRDMLTKESYEGNNFSEGNAVMFDLKNGKTNIIAFCSDKEVAKGIAEGLNLLDNLEADGIELKQLKQKGIL
jgi:hypothetical protein